MFIAKSFLLSLTQRFVSLPFFTVAAQSVVTGFTLASIGTSGSGSVSQMPYFDDHFRVAHAALPHLRRAASIINIGSVTACKLAWRCR